MTVPSDQEMLREAYERCLMLKNLFQARTTIPDELAIKASQLADAIHHYIVPEE